MYGTFDSVIVPFVSYPLKVSSNARVACAGASESHSAARVASTGAVHRASWRPLPPVRVALTMSLAPNLHLIPCWSTPETPLEKSRKPAPCTVSCVPPRRGPPLGVSSETATTRMS